MLPRKSKKERPVVLVHCDARTVEAVSRACEVVRLTHAFDEERLQSWLASGGRAVAYCVGQPSGGDASETIALIRRAHPHAKILLIVETPTAATVVTAFRRRVHCLPTPLEVADIVTFLLLALDVETADLLAEVHVTFVEHHRFTLGQFDVITRRARGEQTSEICEARGISENTYRSIVKAILKKSRLGSMASVIRAYLESGQPE